jgi:hypothetical protein
MLGITFTISNAPSHLQHLVFLLGTPQRLQHNSISCHFARPAFSCLHEMPCHTIIPHTNYYTHSKVKGKVVPVLNLLGTMPCRHGGVEVYLHLSWPRHSMEVSGQHHSSKCNTWRVYTIIFTHFSSVNNQFHMFVIRSRQMKSKWHPLWITRQSCLGHTCDGACHTTTSPTC